MKWRGKRGGARGEQERAPVPRRRRGGGGGGGEVGYIGRHFMVPRCRRGFVGGEWTRRRAASAVGAVFDTHLTLPSKRIALVAGHGVSLNDIFNCLSISTIGRRGASRLL